MSTIQITAKNFDEHASKPGILVVDFWAPWCAPCRTFAPVFEAAASRHPDAAFGKVNTDEEQELGAGFGIQSIPTLMIFRDNILLFEQAGVMGPKDIDAIIGKVRELDMDDVRKQIAQHDLDHANGTCNHDHDHDHDHDHEHSH